MKEKRINNLYEFNMRQFKIYEEMTNRYSLFRLFSFLISLFFLIFGIKNEIWLLNGLCLVSFIVFLIFIIKHKKYESLKNYYQVAIHVLKDYKDRINGDWVRFEDKGLDFKNIESFMLDLDIVGNNSLFQFINIAKTEGGRNSLLRKLSNMEIGEKELLDKQDAISELCNDFELVIDFQSNLNLSDLGNNRISNALGKLKQNIKFNKWHLIIGISLSLITILLLILGLFNIISFYYFGGMFFLQLIQSYIYRALWSDTFNTINESVRAFSSLKNMFFNISNYKFKSSLLKGLKNNIVNSMVGIKEMDKLSTLVSLNNNFMTTIVFNVFFSLNILIIYFYNKVQIKYAKNIHNGIESLEEFESLISLSVIGLVKENVCLPKLNNKVSISFKNLVHPLLIETESVDNSFSTYDEINMITGSNMSGKTSFLRTIGINLILQNAGTFVNGKEFKSCYLKIFTSMRVQDDLIKGISTFYAEVLRLKSAMEYQKSNKPMLVLVDEIFKGTNSNDRITGAKSIINKLNNKNTILFVSTHDFELCDIKGVKNYHFTEEYKNEKIIFDYKIRDGKCKTTNAVYLMKRAGIL